MFFICFNLVNHPPGLISHHFHLPFLNPPFKNISMQGMYLEIREPDELFHEWKESNPWHALVSYQPICMVQPCSPYQPPQQPPYLFSLQPHFDSRPLLKCENAIETRVQSVENMTFIIELSTSKIYEIIMIEYRGHFLRCFFVYDVSYMPIGMKNYRSIDKRPRFIWLHFLNHKNKIRRFL